MSTIPFSDVLDWQPLPIDAQEVVTKVRLVVAGNLAGRAPQRITAYATDDPDTTEAVDYVPWPITVLYEAPEHAIYGAERSFALPTGLNPFLAPTSDLIPEPVAVGFDNPGAPSVVRDGDPETSAEYTAGVGDIGLIRYPFVANAVGMRVKFTLATVAATADNATRTHASITLSPRSAGTRFYGTVFAPSKAASLTPGTRELYMVMPPHANWATENSGRARDGITGKRRLRPSPTSRHAASSTATRSSQHAAPARHRLGVVRIPRTAAGDHHRHAAARRDGAPSPDGPEACTREGRAADLSGR